MNEDEVFAKTAGSYRCLIHPVMEKNTYRLEIAPLTAFSPLVPDELISNMITGASWRERLLGLCLAMAKNPGAFTDAMLRSLQDARGVSIVPTCAALAILARRDLFDMRVLLAADIHRSAFDGEVGWAIDQALQSADKQSKELQGRGPHYGQVFENHPFFKSLLNNPAHTGWSQSMSRYADPHCCWKIS